MRNISVEKLSSKPIGEQTVEFVERKGQGHPDYLIDSCSEAVSLELSRYYLKHYGRILHHNVDKGLLVGGNACSKYGGGKVLKPIYIVVAGRATSRVEGEPNIDDVPVGVLAMKAMKGRLKKLMRYLDVRKHVDFDYKIRQGSEDLVEVFDRSISVPMANDTSFGISYAPLSPAEELTLDVERLLNSRDYKKHHPAVGEDIKVMTLRRNGEIQITIAMAVVDRHVANLRDYIGVIGEVRESILNLIAEKNISEDFKVKINTADDIKKEKIYITVTGTSAESGDDGNTGRGNRINGMIAPGRQNSMEAIAGKNPVNHVGKLYNVLAKRISERVFAEVDGVREIYTKLLSRIGEPIDSPQVVNLQLSEAKGFNFDVISNKATAIAEEETSDITSLTKLIVEEKIELF